MGSLYEEGDKFCCECKCFIPTSLGEYNEQINPETNESEFMCSTCGKIAEQLMTLYAEWEKENGARPTDADVPGLEEGIRPDHCEDENGNRDSGSEATGG